MTSVLFMNSLLLSQDVTEGTQCTNHARHSPWTEMQNVEDGLKGQTARWQVNLKRNF